VWRWIPFGIFALLAAEIGLITWFAATHNPVDLNIYLWGGQAVGHGARLYLTRVTGDWFTYPPFAAITFIPLTALPVVAVRLGWALGSVLALAWASVSTLELAGYRPSRTAVAGTVAVTLLLEPMYHTLVDGQVNLFLLAFVLADVRRVARGRPAGIGVGLAGAIKLTPAIFVILFLLTRRASGLRGLRSAAIAAVTFLGCGLLGYAVAPAASRLYWQHLWYDTSRVGSPYISNQSPYGAAIRIAGWVAHGVPYVRPWYYLIPVTIAAAGLPAAAALARRGAWLSAAALTGATGLLVSPISWTHHWVWILPALVVLVRGGHRISAASGYLLFAVAPMWFTPWHGGPREYGFHWLVTAVANCYLLAGLAFVTHQVIRACRAPERALLPVADSTFSLYVQDDRDATR
jgi:alpha-1,2-mannosyltransferase